MIRYPIDPAELIQRINGLKPNWITDALQRTDEYTAARDYTGGTEFWPPALTMSGR